MITALLAIASIYTPAITLEIEDTQFLVDGKPTFLLGASYYGALGAPDAFVERDLHESEGRMFQQLDDDEKSVVEKAASIGSIKR